MAEDVLGHVNLLADSGIEMANEKILRGVLLVITVNNCKKISVKFLENMGARIIPESCLKLRPSIQPLHFLNNQSVTELGPPTTKGSW